MPAFNQLPRWVLRTIHRPPQIAYAIGLGPLIGRMVLLLTTTGRKSGLPRVTPLQYEEVDGAFMIGSSRGQKADWYLNIVANPRVEIRVKNRRFCGIAETVTDPERIATFLELRLRRHPRMVGAMLKSDGFSSHPDHRELLEYSRRLALVIVHENGRTS
ncbi:MAG: nitroreductase family deazaflavin-dependent oxidoreductase [Chloroflexota bacterium]|nr:MAG: nitroreductase family deazaflavin-dependent oxidoreductase [Chloroflexota bacterium]